MYVCLDIQIAMLCSINAWYSSEGTVIFHMITCIVASEKMTLSGDRVICMVWSGDFTCFSRYLSCQYDVEESIYIYIYTFLSPSLAIYIYIYIYVCVCVRVCVCDCTNMKKQDIQRALLFILELFAHFKRFSFYIKSPLGCLNMWGVSNFFFR